MTFKYGTAGDLFDIAQGDIWTVGSHTFLCGDLERGACDRLFEVVGVPDHLYVDPPWNKALARSYRTKAGVDGPLGRPVDFRDAFLPMLLRIAAKIPGEIGVEIGRQHVEDVELGIKALGGRVKRRHAITYYGKSPCCFVHGTFTSEMSEAPAAGIDGLDEPEAVSEWVRTVTKPGQTLLDPCMGQGLAAVVGHSHGLRVVGVEMHPRRLAVTLQKLVTLTGLQAVRR